MRILVTGGAGYIGAHVVRLLRERGDAVVVVDDLSSGDPARVAGIPLIDIDIAMDAGGVGLAAAMREYAIDTVVHFAARKQVAESVSRPVWYYQQNVSALANLLAAMADVGLGRLVFSSSAAVYGAAAGAEIAESDPAIPINPYGETKLVGEWLIENVCRVSSLGAVSLRYFNVAGTGWPDLADRTVSNLVPMVFERIDAGLPPLIFGDDYDTVDGTCVRDFIHVLDLAEAHIVAIDYLAAGGSGHSVFNVGTGIGTSVRAIVDRILDIADVALQPEVRERRPGDPARVVASPEAIARATGWRANRSVDEMIASAWATRSSRASLR